MRCQATVCLAKQEEEPDKWVNRDESAGRLEFREPGLQRTWNAKSLKAGRLKTGAQRCRSAESLECRKP